MKKSLGSQKWIELNDPLDVKLANLEASKRFLKCILKALDAKSTSGKASFHNPTRRINQTRLDYVERDIKSIRDYKAKVAKRETENKAILNMALGLDFSNLMVDSMLKGGA